MLSMTVWAVSRPVPQSPTYSLFQGDLGAQEGQPDPWDQDALLDPLSLVGLETLEDPDLPTRDVTSLCLFQMIITIKKVKARGGRD